MKKKKKKSGEPTIKGSQKRMPGGFGRRQDGKEATALPEKSVRERWRVSEG